MAEHEQTARTMDWHGFNGGVVEEFRANDGRIVSMPELNPVLLLTTIGAKSGQRRLSPLTYMPDDGRFVVIGSKLGSPTHPDWYHNIVANQDVTIEVGTATLPARARIATGAERERLFNSMAKERPRFAETQQTTPRPFPVIVLERKDEDS